MFAHQRDLGQGSGIEMANTGVVESLQYQQVGIAFHRVKHATREIIQKVTRLAFEFCGTQTVNRVSRFQVFDNIFDRRESWQLDR